MSPNAEDACHPQLFFDSSVPQVTVTSKSLINSINIFLTFPPAAHLHTSQCPLTGNFALRSTATPRQLGGKLSPSSSARTTAAAPLLAPSDQDAAGGEGFNLDTDARHLADLASLTNGTCSALSTLKSACVHSHQMAIAPCGKGIVITGNHSP